MLRDDKSFVEVGSSLPEITLKGVILAILLALLLGVANAYLALRIGLLTSASIPAAILSMGILRLFKRSNILENNMVQTAASAGEAIAGGIVFTIPALIIIHYWHHFSYWENFFIAFCGSFLGVLFSIPLRRVLMTEKHLHYPEGRAIAEVLQVGENGSLGLSVIALGALGGAIIELLQSGFKLIASSLQLWFHLGRVLFGMGAGFSVTMVGAGYLVGINVAVSIFIGAMIGWMLGVPLLSSLYGQGFTHGNVSDAVMQLWGHSVRYIGIGAMLIAGLWTLITLFKPFYQSIVSSMAVFASNSSSTQAKPLRTERDIPMPIVLSAIAILLVITYVLFANILPLQVLGLSQAMHVPMICIWLLVIVVVGFCFSAITGYFSGLVGVTASPGSAIVIAGLLLSALLLLLLIKLFVGAPLSAQQSLSACAFAIIMGAILTGIACIANDNIQDLKVGHLVGATPWKQQVMLLLGALVASAIIPFVMELLFNVYGIADVLPHPHMDPSETLPAPPAALMAAITQGVFQGNLPWTMLGIGAGLAVLIIILQLFLQRHRISLSCLAIAIGIYLPITTTTPIFIGGLIAYFVKKRVQRDYASEADALQKSRQKGLLLACGLVVGSTVMDVLLAIPFAIFGNPEILQIPIPHWQVMSELLGVASIVAVAWWFFANAKVVKR